MVGAVSDQQWYGVWSLTVTMYQDEIRKFTLQGAQNIENKSFYLPASRKTHKNLDTEAVFLHDMKIQKMQKNFKKIKPKWCQYLEKNMHQSVLYVYECKYPSTVYYQLYLPADMYLM